MGQFLQPFAHLVLSHQNCYRIVLGLPAIYTFVTKVAEESAAVLQDVGWIWAELAASPLGTSVTRESSAVSREDTVLTEPLRQLPHEKR